MIHSKIKEGKKKIISGVGYVASLSFVFWIPPTPLPPSKGLDERPPPPSYLEVWILH